VDAVAKGLVVALLSVLLIAMLVITEEVTSAVKAATLRHQNSKQALILPQYARPTRYHLFLSHVWSTGQDQVQAIKKELELLVPTIKVFLDVEDLDNIGGLETKIEESDVTLLFLTDGYFASWNVLREVRHAVMIDVASPHATRASNEAAQRRRAAALDAISTSTNIIVVLEREEIHNVLPLDKMLLQCPEFIGCEDHVNKYDEQCSRCLECPVNIRKHLQARAQPKGGSDKVAVSERLQTDGGAVAAGGVVTWMRAKHFKLVCLKQIVQQLLIAADYVGSSDTGLNLRGELCQLVLVTPPRGARPCVLIHSGLHLSSELLAKLPQVTSGLEILAIDNPGLGIHTEESLQGDIHMALRRGVAPRLVVVLHEGVFLNKRVLASLMEALDLRVPIVLVHEKEETRGGCSFGRLIDECPGHLKARRGFSELRLFDPIAIEWSHHPIVQPVSLRLLALAVGAVPLKKRKWYQRDSWYQGGGCRRSLRRGAAGGAAAPGADAEGEGRLKRGTGGGWSVFAKLSEESAGTGLPTQSNPLSADDPQNPLHAASMPAAALGRVRSQKSMRSEEAAGEGRAI
jgi:hypothetical protein